MSANHTGGAATEAFKPIAIRPPSESPLLFAVRCAVDLQMLTMFRFLRPALAACRGRVLDVGAGEAPWRELVTDAEYTGLDVEGADDFGMRRLADIVYYDGRTIPFADASFDHLLTVEVLEHVADPVAFITELTRVLRSGGSLIMTIPWSARLHHVPHDYTRFTRYGLLGLLSNAGYVNVRIDERGNDIAVIANKLVVLSIRLLRPRRWAFALATWPLALFAVPAAVSFLVAAHVAIRCGWGSREDPLGYGVIAVKR